MLYTQFHVHRYTEPSMVCLVLCVLLLLHASNVTPSTFYTCQEIGNKTFASFNATSCHLNSDGSINCLIYLTVQQNFESDSKNLSYFTKYFETRIDFQAQPGENSSQDADWMCVHLKHATAKIVDLPLPGYPINGYLPATSLSNSKGINLAIFDVIKRGEISLETEGSAGVGFLKLNDGCSLLNTVNSSCLKELRVIDVLFDAERDKFRDKCPNGDCQTADLYHEAFAATITHLTFALKIKSVFSWLWLKFVGDNAPLVQLSFLDAGKNYFTRLTKGAIGDMPSLRYLGLYDCRMQHLDPATFDAVQNLEILDLSENMLAAVPDLRNLPHLYSLNISSQNVPSLDVQPISLIISLKILNISRNSLLYFNRTVLSSSAALQVLDASYCALTALDEDLFNPLKSLKLLLLNNNPLHKLSSNVFFTLPTNASVLLRRCQLSSPLELNLNSLELLDLSYNNLTNSRNVLNGSVNHLDVSANKILNWTHDLNLITVKNLNLSYNLISIVNDLMSPSVDTLNTIDLGGNPLNCADCKIKEFQEWLATSKVNILNLGADEPLACVVPPEQRTTLIKNAIFNATLCMPAVNYAIVAGVPVGFVSALLMVLGILSVVFRSQYKYIRHLMRIRREAMQVPEDDKTYLYDVFVCYCSKDRDWVINVLLPGLENPIDRYKLCLHERDFRIGSYIMDNIGECMEKSRRVLLVLTSNFIDSKWCLWELRLAQQRKIESRGNFLILVELEKLQRKHLPMHLRSLMDTLTYLEWSDNTQSLRDFWDRLKLAIGDPAGTVEEHTSSCESSDVDEQDSEFLRTSHSQSSEFLMTSNSQSTAKLL